MARKSRQKKIAVEGLRDKNNNLTYQIRILEIGIDLTDLATRLYKGAFKSKDKSKEERKLVGRIVLAKRENYLEARLYSPKNPLSANIVRVLRTIDNDYDALIRPRDERKYEIKFSNRINSRVVDSLCKNY